jgi:hypothetical protein
MKYKLGLKPPVNDIRSLKLGNYLNLSTLPTPPSAFDWTLALTQNYSMYANGPAPDNPPGIKDGVGDCFFAMQARRRVLATANANSIIVPTVDECLGSYSGCTGFDINNPTTTDYGTEPVQGMKYMARAGMGLGPRNFKIGAYVMVDWTKPDQMAAALWIFGHLFIGIEFPASYEWEPQWGASNDAIIGGHAILGQAMHPDGSVLIDSWAQDIVFTQPGIQQKCTFMAVALCPDWISPLGSTMSGFDEAALENDLKLIQAP